MALAAAVAGCGCSLYQVTGGGRVSSRGAGNVLCGMIKGLAGVATCAPVCGHMVLPDPPIETRDGASPWTGKLYCVPYSAL